jgi:hypothetical protein
MCGTVTGFQHDRCHAAFEDMRGGGKPNGAGADDCNGLWVTHAASPIKLEISK